MAEGFDGVHAGGADCGEKSGDDAYHGEDDERDEHDRGGGAKDDVALVICGLVHLGVEGHGRDEIRDDDGDDHADDAGEEGEGETFEQELREDVAAAGSEGFEEADLAWCAR